MSGVSVDDWEDADLAKELGWYAALQCWDPDEGAFPIATWWDGTVWRQAPDGPKEPAITLFVASRPCVSKDDAKKLAYELDPNW